MKENFLWILLVFSLLVSCEENSSYKKDIYNRDNKIDSNLPLDDLKDYSNLADREVMVVGTFHFGKEVLEQEQQKEIKKIIKALKKFRPTKVVLEWEPKLFEKANNRYREFIKDSFSIDNKFNEVYQIGFRLAKELKHDSIYFFDDQTEYIGSLSEFSTGEDPFSFYKFMNYAEKEDKGFYDKHLDSVQSIYKYNQELIQKEKLLNQIALLNSPQSSKINAQRMHLFEMRVGIQKSWVGPDWLGRWYRRNIRMASNVLSLSEKGDKILIIVGDNHKWTLDMLFENIPDFEVVQSFEYFENK